MCVCLYIAGSMWLEATLRTNVYSYQVRYDVRVRGSSMVALPETARPGCTLCTILCTMYIVHRTTMCYIMYEYIVQKVQGTYVLCTMYICTSYIVQGTCTSYLVRVQGSPSPTI